MADIEIIPPQKDAKKPQPNNLLRTIYAIALIILIVWLIGIFLKFAAWLISGLVYLAAVIVIIGIILQLFRKYKK